MDSMPGHVLVIWLTALVPTILACLYHPRLPDVNPQILKEGEVFLQSAIEWGPSVIWVDARSADDYAAEHIPGALLLNEDRWDELIEPLITSWLPDRRVVVYCSSLACQASQKVAERLRDEMGLERVYVLKNGWDAWLRRDK